MKPSLSIRLLAAFALLGVSISSFAQTTATSDPVGFVSVTVKANSDATIAVPLNRPAVFKGVILSIGGIGSNVITVAGTSPNWADNQFVQSLPTQVNTYAVQIATGSKEGMVGKIVANGANTVTIQLDSGDDLTGVTTEAANGAGNGDHIDIMPYWTPSTLFSVAPPVGFELGGFETGEAGINFGSTEIYSHTGSNVWEDLILGGSGANTPLRFGAALIARNYSATNYTATFAGAVPMTKSRIRLSTRAANTAQDQYIGYMSPVLEPLATPTNPNALGFPVMPGDTIQGFDNNVSGINKGADEIYSWTGTAWEDLINGGNVTPNLQGLKPGFGYIFQKAPTLTPTSVVWSKAPSYLQQ